MRARWSSALVVVAPLLFVSATASAQTAAAPPAKGAVRKDPEGKTGISPYMEQIAKGEAAYVARDFPAAIAAFQEAIKLDGQKMLGFYRLGEAQLNNGKPDEADATWQAALSKKGPDDLMAKLLFVIADLRERQTKLDAAKDAWAAYAAFLQNNAKAAGYPATPPERQKVGAKRTKDLTDYAAVKDRIAKREAERQKEAEENAKKDKLNR